MANHFLAFIYGEVQSTDPGTPAYARSIDYSAALAGNKSFPSANTVFHPLSPAQTFGGVSCNSIVEVLPTGVHNWSRKYCCDATVSTLNTSAA